MAPAPAVRRGLAVVGTLSLAALWWCMRLFPDLKRHRPPLEAARGDPKRASPSVTAPWWFASVVESVGSHRPPCARTAPFVAVSLYSVGSPDGGHYEKAFGRLVASCSLVGVCCTGLALNWSALVAVAAASDAVDDATAARHGLWSGTSYNGNGDVHTRARALAIGLKPAALLVAARRFRRPVALLDCDLEFRRWPEAFVLAGADVMVFNWVVRAPKALPVAAGAGDRLKAASGVIFINNTDAALEVLEAWTRAQYTGANAVAPDDQTLDAVYMARRPSARFAWLPDCYLPIRPGSCLPGEEVLVHDEGRRPGIWGRNSNLKPRLDG